MSEEQRDDKPQADYARSIAREIIADYKEHYSFPPQGESHMHDCIMDALEAALDVARESGYAHGRSSMQSAAAPRTLSIGDLQCDFHLHDEGEMMLDKTREQLVRDLLAAKKIMDAASEAFTVEREKYRELAGQFCAMNPLPGNPPEPVVCGETFIKPGRYWRDERKGYTESESHDGMSLRDYFAGQAMQGFAVGICIASAEALTPEKAAALAYHYADAMLKHRSSGDPH